MNGEQSYKEYEKKLPVGSVVETEFGLARVTDLRHDYPWFPHAQMLIATRPMPKTETNGGWQVWHKASKVRRIA